MNSPSSIKEIQRANKLFQPWKLQAQNDLMRLFQKTIKANSNLHLKLLLKGKIK